MEIKITVPDYDKSKGFEFKWEDILQSKLNRRMTDWLFVQIKMDFVPWRIICLICRRIIFLPGTISILMNLTLWKPDQRNW